MRFNRFGLLLAIPYGRYVGFLRHTPETLCELSCLDFQKAIPPARIRAAAHRTTILRREELTMRLKPYASFLVALAVSTFGVFSVSAQDRDDWGRHGDDSHRAQTIHATISGGTGNGKCTFEVVVTGVADVEIRGDEGRLISVDGAPAEWRRLDCNQPVPSSTNDFHFSGKDGHGRQNLEQSPSVNSGVAVIRIDNTHGEKAGKAEGYTGDITWKGGRYAEDWHGDRGHEYASNSWNGGPSGSVASQACMNAVATRIQQEHQNVTNLRPMPDTTTEAQRDDGKTSVQGEGQYQSENSNYGKFSYRCLYDPATQSVLESSYSRE